MPLPPARQSRGQPESATPAARQFNGQPESPPPTAPARQPHGQPEPLPPAARIPLLALHGFTGSGADFQWLAAQTADLFQWYTPDLPGHGTNAHAPATAHTPAAVTRAINVALQTICNSLQKTNPHLPQVNNPATIPSINAINAAHPRHAHDTTLPASNSTKPRHPRDSELLTNNAAHPRLPHDATPLPLLLGYSMGGRMALRYLAQYGTTNVSGVILISASAGLANATERRARRTTDHALAQRIEAEGTLAFMQRWNSQPLIASQSRSPYFEQLQQMRRTNNPTGLARSLRGIGTGAVAPLHSHLPHLNIPCLLLTGAEDTKFTTLAAQMTKHLPKAHHVVISNTGHSPHWENPQATAEAIRTWAT